MRAVKAAYNVNSDRHARMILGQLLWNPNIQAVLWTMNPTGIDLEDWRKRLWLAAWDHGTTGAQVSALRLPGQVKGWI